MALKDVVEGIENRIDHLFEKEGSDPAAAREPVLRAIKRAEDQWASPPPGEEPDWFHLDGERVAFSPRLENGAPLTIDGVTTVFVPADRFPDYLANMRTAVEAGVFDSEIMAGLAGSPNVSGLASVPMPEAREGDREMVREQQRTEILHRDGRNPDGSLIRAVGERDGTA